MDFEAEKQRLQGELQRFQEQLTQLQQAQALLAMEMFKRKGALEELDKLWMEEGYKEKSE